MFTYQTPTRHALLAHEKRHFSYAVARSLVGSFAESTSSWTSLDDASGGVLYESFGDAHANNDRKHAITAKITRDI